MAVREVRQWQVTASREVIFDAMAGVVLDHGGQVLTKDPFQAKTGGFWKTRFLGWLTQPVDLPLRIFAVIEDVQGTVMLRVQIDDRIGFGIRTGMVGKLRARILDLLSELQEATTQESVAERLRQLAHLRSEGILTEEEYQSKRSELAERL